MLQFCGREPQMFSKYANFFLNHLCFEAKKKTVFFEEKKSQKKYI
jgi:hypothetical protein